MSNTERPRTRIETFEMTRICGHMALVWAYIPPGPWQVFQVYSGPTQSAVYADAEAYARAIRCGGADDGPWPSGVNRREKPRMGG